VSLERDIARGGIVGDHVAGGTELVDARLADFATVCERREAVSLERPEGRQRHTMPLKGVQANKIALAWFAAIAPGESSESNSISATPRPRTSRPLRLT
jgi:hypothetical protein